MSAQFTINHDDQLSTLSVNGRFDMQAVLKVDEIVKDIPEGNTLQIDLAGCDYLDSAGLGSLLSLRSAFARKDKPIMLKNCSDKIRHILKVMNFENFFEI